VSFCKSKWLQIFSSTAVKGDNLEGVLSMFSIGVEIIGAVEPQLLNRSTLIIVRCINALVGVKFFIILKNRVERMGRI
jgi:hypothetical protein